MLCSLAIEPRGFEIISGYQQGLGHRTVCIDGFVFEVHAIVMAKTTTAKAAPKKTVRKIRFQPDPGTLAEIRFEQLGVVLFGLVLNESAGGCAVVVSTSKKIITGTMCKAKVGNLSWAGAEVRWSKKVDTDLYKLGLEYHL